MLKSITPKRPEPTPTANEKNQKNFLINSSYVVNKVGRRVGLAVGATTFLVTTNGYPLLVGQKTGYSVPLY